MLCDPTEVARFEACAHEAGAEFVERFLMDDVDAVVARFDRRGGSTPDDAWHQQVRRIVAANGGDDVLVRNHEALERLLEKRPHALVLGSTEGAVDETYARLLASLDAG